VKKTDLEKHKAKKLTNSLKQAAPHSRGNPAELVVDRREQRRLDQLAGLVPFACKLDAALVARLQELAATHPGGMSSLLGELLTSALAARPAA
jgi:hypothetical protein